MEELNELQETLRKRRPVEWNQLPDIPLYMDQVLYYMDRQSIRVDEADALTSAMVNNYTNGGLVPRADGKKYSREHLAYLTAICVLKQVMPAKDMALLIAKETQGECSMEEMYGRFCESLDRALAQAADEMEPYLTEDQLADGAVHFALLSYAAGVVSRRYVNILRNLEPEARKKK